MIQSTQVLTERVVRGVREDGSPCAFSVNHLLRHVLDRAIVRVTQKKWDYVSIVAGLPGSGKSTFAQMCARYCCRWFTRKYVAFDAESFIRITTECPPFSAVILDESFEALNSKMMYNPDFIRIVNHLQIIRQKNLFIFLCLPNFFDLSKGVAVFRSSNLFVTYGDEEDNKGYFMCFGREEKTQLFVKGSKFMDYNAHPANFHGRFRPPNVIPEEVYEAMKAEHMRSSNKKYSKYSKDKDRFIRLVRVLKIKEGYTIREIAEMIEEKLDTIKSYFKPSSGFSSDAP